MNVLVLGASDNPDRYSYMAVHKLIEHGHKVFPVGIKKAEVAGLEIINSRIPLKDIHTISIYIAPRNQPEWYEYIITTNPKRIIFNPGAENQELLNLVVKQGIESIEACTLVMLATDQFLK